MTLNLTDCRPPLNGSVLDISETGNGTDLIASSAIKHDWLKIALPAICLLGIIGNILNLLVLSRRRLMSGMDRLERSSNYGLIALAFSDMMFCVLVFPYTFIKGAGDAVEVSRLYELYYKIYGAALINLFLMTSSWLIMMMAFNRYLVVLYPFKARQILGTRRTLGMILSVYFFSIFMTFPFFLHPGVHHCQRNDRTLIQYTPLWELRIVNMIKTYNHWVWPVVADFIPVIVLAFCNTKLIQLLRTAIKNRKRTCQGQVVKDSSHKTTLTLVIIVLMLLLLVSPGEVLRYVNPYELWGPLVGHTVASIANVMQALNFALNFVLYCAVNANFRNTIKSMLFCCKEEHQSAPMTNTTLVSARSVKNGIAFKSVKTEDIHDLDAA